MQTRLPREVAASLEGAPKLDVVLGSEATSRGASVQAALILLTQFSSGSEVFMSDVIELAGYINRGTPPDQQ